MGGFRTAFVCVFFGASGTLSVVAQRALTALTLLCVMSLLSLPSTAASGALWVAAGHNVNRLDPDTHLFSQALPLGQESRALALAPEGNALWVLTSTTLLKLDANTHPILTLDLRTLAGGFTDAKLLQLNPYDASLWVGSKKSLLHFSSEGSLISQWQSPDNIQAIVLDTDESLWILTPQALLHLSASSALLSTTPLNGLLNDPRYLALDQVGHRITAADSQQVLQFDLSDLSSPPRHLDLTLGFSGRAAGETETISALSADPRLGTVWVATPEHLITYDRDGHFVKRVALNSFGTGTLVTLTFNLAQGNLWLVGTQALAQFDASGQFMGSVAVDEKINAIGVAPFILRPTVSLLAPPDGGTTNKRPLSLQFGLGAACDGIPCMVNSHYTDALSLDVTLNNQAIGQLFNIAAGEATYSPLAPLPEGVSTMVAQAKDTFGHRSDPLTAHFMVDTVAPKFLSISPVGGSIVTTSAVTIEGALDDSTASVMLFDASDKVVSKTSGASFGFAVKLNPGLNSFTLVAWDTASNKTTMALHLNYGAANGATGPIPLTTSAAGIATPATPVPPAAVVGATASQAYGHIPLSFELNQGQTHESVKFITRSAEHAVFFTHGETVTVLRNPRHKPAHLTGMATVSPESASALATQYRESLDAAQPADALATATESEPASAVLRMKLVGAQPAPHMEGLEPLEAKSNYLIGNDPSKWIKDVPHFAKVKYHDVYPGIDQVFYGKEGELEYDLIVQPGADPASIKLAFDSTKPPSLNDEGDMILQTDLGAITHRKPVLYQDIDGIRSTVAGRYRVQSSGEIGIEVKDYDRSRPLVIDPTIVYSTYLGGSGAQYGYAIAVDSAGSAYVTGSVASLDFPTVNPYQGSKAGGYWDVFIAKLNPAGTGLVYSTYMGGSTGDDYGNGIAVDATGSAHVAGQTFSTNFPTTAGALQTTLKGFASGFVTKLNPAGNGLIYSTYLGGGGPATGSEITGITVDAQSNAYVTGNTGALDFPLKNAYQSTGSTASAFVTKFDAGGGLVYSTYLGGIGSGGAGVFPYGIAVDAAQSAYVTGYASTSGFPTKTPIYPCNSEMVFVTKLDPTGATLAYSTCLQGSAHEHGVGNPTPNRGGIAVDTQGNAYIAGTTNSMSLTTVNAIKSTHWSWNYSNYYLNTGFVTKINPAGTAQVYATYLGGSGNTATSTQREDNAYAIAVDSSGSAFVTGWSSSAAFPIVNPLTGGATLGQATSMAFVTKFDPAGNTLAYSTFLGGTNTSANQSGRGIAVDGSGNAYVMGYTNATNFPVVNPLKSTNASATTQVFVTKINAPAPPTVAITAPASGAVFTAPASIGVTASANSSAGYLSKLEFFDGVTPLSTYTVPANTATVIYTLPLSGVAAGPHSYTVKATDTYGSATSTAVAVNVYAPPTATITAPASGAVFTAPASINVTASASSSAGYLTKLDFFDGVTPLSTYTAPANTASVNYTLPLSGVAAGPHSYTVKATDTYGSATSTAVAVNVYAPPTATITAPASGTVFTAPASIGITASASSSAGYLTKLDFFDGSTPLSTYTVPANTASVNYTLPLSGVVAGPHSYTVKATDTYGNTTSTAVAVTVYPAPTVSLTAPASGTLFIAPALFTLQATAASPNGSVSRVDFFGNNALLGTVTAPPYNLTWNNPTAGSYSLTVKVTDSVGASATTAPVTITVASNPGMTVTTPVNGATIPNDRVTVSGSVQTIANSSVSVNGILGALATDGTFFVSNVPLTPGANTLTVTVTAPDGQSKTQTLSVTSSGQLPFVFEASPGVGLAPLTVNFMLNNRGNVTFDHADVYCQSNGSVSISIPATNLANSTALGFCTYVTPGKYTAKVNVLDASAAVLYTDTQTIQADSVAARNAMLQGVYFGMLDQLKAGNINGALNSMTGTVAAKYAAIFNAMRADPALAANLDQIRNIQDGRLGNGYAEYLVVRTISGVSTGSFIYLIQGGDGVWRIDGM